MKDMLGVEIAVGDEIVYVSKPYTTLRLTVGTVVEVDDVSVKVDRRHAGHSVVNGMTEKWVWDAKSRTGEHVPIKARSTRIFCSERCMVTKKA